MTESGMAVIPADQVSATVTQTTGWQASLALDFARAGTRTVMRRRHSGPLLVQRPFYPEGETCHAVILHPPAGIVGGDQLKIDVHCSQHGSAVITTPGATRFYGSDGRVAQQRQRVTVESASVEWLPQETIYFDRCLAQQELVVHIDRHSRFIGWDINCFGRPAGNQLFVNGRAAIALRVIVEGLPVLQERLVIEGSRDNSDGCGQFAAENTTEHATGYGDAHRLSGLRGATVSATLVAVAPSLDPQHWLSVARQVLPASDYQFAATQIDSVLAVRYLGNNAEAARSGFTRVWRALRPLLLQKDAVTPRIWAT